jgi:transposase-like protein
MQIFPPEVWEAAVQRYLTSDLTLTAVAAQFGTSRYSVSNWLKQAEARSEMSKKPKPHPVAAATARGCTKRSKPSSLLAS